MYGDMLSSEELKQMQKDSVFYTNNLFAEIDEYHSEKKRLEAEAEAKRVAEEKKKLEEAEAKRIAEEKKQQAEAEAKRIAEEKRQQAEAEAKRIVRENKLQEESEAMPVIEESRNKTAEYSLQEAGETEKPFSNTDPHVEKLEQLSRDEVNALYDAIATGSEPEKLKELQYAADHGNSWAINCIGLCYEYGHGVKKNYKKAIEWYQKSADAGNAVAMCNLGICYENGNGVKKNLKTAIEWYQKSADAGNANAMGNLGNCYYDGNGVKRNYKKAVEWYQKAAELSNAYGMSGMGLCYEFGNGVKQDYAEALKWYKKALENGREKDEWITDRMENCRLEGKPNVKIINVDSTGDFYSVGHSLVAEIEWSGDCGEVKLCWTLNPLFAGISITEEDEIGNEILFLSATDLGLSKSGKYEYEGNLSAYDKGRCLLASYNFHLIIKYNHKFFGSDEIKILEMY